MSKMPRILYFINGPVPSEAEVADSLKYGNNVVFRNAELVRAEDKIEACDGVVGEIPAPYKKAPSAKKALAAFEAALTKAAAQAEKAAKNANDGWTQALTPKA